jgi:hypothetical protein
MIPLALRKARPPGRVISNSKIVLVFAHACKLGAEGILSKRIGSRYRSGLAGLAENQESLFMRMVVTAGVVTCALVTSAHATWNARRSGISGARWKMRRLE